MAKENRKSLGRYTSHHEHHHKEDPKITLEVSWSDNNDDDHEEENEACLMAVRSQKIHKEHSIFRPLVPNSSGIEVCIYADSDHAGDYVDRNSTSGICTLVGGCLTQWCCKKQTALALSTTKAEYVVVERAYQQSLWMKQAMKDYDINCKDVFVLCDNKGAINLSKNPIHHS
ncbi:hypothetical protein Tco_0179376 [Tanacetum coccineum]